MKLRKHILGYSDNWNENGNNIWNNRNDFPFNNGNGNGFGNGNNGFGNFSNNGPNNFGNNFGNNFANDRFGNNGGNNNIGNNGGGNNLGFGMFGNNSNNGNNGGNGYGALNTLGFGGLSDLRNNRGGFGNNNNLGGNNFGGNMGGGNSNCGNDMNDFFCIHLRGMPYYCDEMDIMKVSFARFESLSNNFLLTIFFRFQFFSPLKPVHCNVIYNNKGIHSGGGNAWFKTHDEAEEAMKRDKDKMGSRYIELFYDNPPSSKNRRRF